MVITGTFIVVAIFHGGIIIVAYIVSKTFVLIAINA